MKEAKTAEKVGDTTIVRVLNTDLNGNKRLAYALKGIKGISYTTARAVCIAAGYDPNIKLKTLTEQDIEHLEKVIRNPGDYGIPSYLFNRRKDLETGKDMHLTGSDLEIRRKLDIERYINLKTYRGWRHMLGQPVRGQRTRSHFREKGRVVGVVRKTVKIASSQEKKK